MFINIRNLISNLLSEPFIIHLSTSLYFMDEYDETPELIRTHFEFNDITNKKEKPKIILKFANSLQIEIVVNNDNLDNIRKWLNDILEGSKADVPEEIKKE